MSEQSPRMSFPYPSIDDDPWSDGFQNLINALDRSGFSVREDRNLLLAEGGTVTWDSSTGTVTWSAAIYMTAPQSGFSWRIQPDSAVLTDGEVFRVTLNRNPLTNTNLAVTVSGTVPNTDDDIVVAIRVGARLYWRNGVMMNNGDSFTNLGGSQGAAGGALTRQDTYANGPDIAQDTTTGSMTIDDTGGGVGIEDQDLLTLNKTSGPGTGAAVRIQSAGVDIIHVANEGELFLTTRGGPAGGDPGQDMNLTTGDGQVDQPGGSIVKITGVGGAVAAGVGGKGGDDTAALGAGGATVGSFAAGAGGGEGYVAGPGGTATGGPAAGDGGDVVRIAGAGGAGSGTSDGGDGGDYQVDAGPLGAAGGSGADGVPGSVLIGTVQANAVTSGNFTSTANFGSPWTHRGRSLVQGPGSAGAGEYGLAVQPQRTETQGTRTVAQVFLLDDTVSAIGGSPSIIIVDGDPNGQVTAGAPGSIAIDPTTGFVYKRNAGGGNSWSSLGVDAGSVQRVIPNGTTITVASGFQHHVSGSIEVEAGGVLEAAAGGQIAID